MTIRVALNHYTRYRYDRPVALSPHVVRLRPAPHSRTPIRAYSLRITPDTHFINWQQDPFGNYLARLVFPEKTAEFSVEVDLVADLTVINPFDFFLEEYAETVPFRYPAALAEELAPYLKIREQGPRLQAWLVAVDRTPETTMDFLVGLNQRLQGEIGYSIRMEPGVQSCEETLARSIGSCRDSAWLLCQILRHLGLAARFVSGYLVQLVADLKSLDGPSGPEQDFTDLHAWTEVYLPGAGWVGLDPTSGLLASEGHIPLACSPDPGSAAPIAGGVDKAETDFYFHNQVTRIHEDPRVTKPYADGQWQLIDRLGRQVDEDLQAMDVRLTMGGEPTFVSIDDMDSPQWNSAALGAHKRQLAGTLFRRLQRRFAPGGVLQFGQGKWYPGEPLPRWALACVWRKDGVPIWQNADLIAADGRDYGHSVDDAERFTRQLARRLRLKPYYAVPCCEDTVHYLLEENRLPVNIDPLQADLEDPLERRRLAALLERGLNVPTGYVLPLSRGEQAQWESSIWPLRRGVLFLVPGDSPMGLRLPLDSLPWRAPEQRAQEEGHPRDPFAPHPPLRDIHGEVAQRFSTWGSATEDKPFRVHEQRAESEGDWGRVIHTALCVEPRDGVLHVFLPPFHYLEDYLDLVATVEATAADLNLPVRLEGYEPPHDSRVERFLVTPDPGVIEVNIHPSRYWQELVERTEVLYEEAYRSRLGTEKFMLDGRHTGTGGGNHVTLGGPTAADSPLLRRPDLLRSLLTYWQHHPSLSYLFSGLFIGPTSQSPRIDEARHESLYELEIAFQRLAEESVAEHPAQNPVQDKSPPPWLVDRLLRHLLVDLTGNTHRAEFCIDKLYSPDSPTGRLGLLELRGFEMPPHARMSLMQMLLIRALVALFWKQPYQGRLVRWGTELHDRFMLPHYVWQDSRQVVEDLGDRGYPFQLEWLDPFFEFRFPVIGRIQVDTLELELRTAIEPWHVLGEETTAIGTARFVDSSVERLQVLVRGMTSERYAVVCNGRRVPLRPTGVKGEWVAGVRYRAWQPPSALHPTIPPDSPLVFDVIDLWNGRAIGGCTYHVSHPGGRSFEDFPVNAAAAETRRGARFWNFGHTPGPIQPPPEFGRMGRFVPEGSPLGPFAPPREEVNAEYPTTLDLRRRPS